MKNNIKYIVPVLIMVFISLPLFIIRAQRAEEPAPEEDLHTIIEGYISEGDTLGNLLMEQGIPPAQTHYIAASLQEVFNPRRIMVGDRWEIYLDQDEQFTKFKYHRGPINFYTVKLDNQENRYTASAKTLAVETRLRGTVGEIRSSLYESMRYVDVNPEIIIQFAEIFASKIDFFTECQTGDSFNVLWESYFDKEGNVLQDTRISAASYSSSNATHYAFHYRHPDSEKSGYYDEKGESVESAFLRAPLNYRRISSHFTHRRFHPIHRVYRPHLGIDYVAPSGTPVSAIGNGTVQFAGWRQDGFGITVIINHPNNYVSWYGHLSRVQSGIRKGTRVSKGQVIGYVGSTGSSTGPHLDFRIQENGKFVNFLTLKLPPSHPLPEEHLPDFQKHRDILTANMQNLIFQEIQVIDALIE